MKKFYINLLTILFFPILSVASDKLPYDTQRKIFIYETIRDYNIDSDLEERIAKSILEPSEKEELNGIIEKQRKIHLEIMNDKIFSLLHRSIPSDYIMKELDSLEKKGEIPSGIKLFISNANDAGFSLQGTFEHLREMIIQDRQRKSQ